MTASPPSPPGDDEEKTVLVERPVFEDDVPSRDERDRAHPLAPMVTPAKAGEHGPRIVRSKARGRALEAGPKRRPSKAQNPGLGAVGPGAADERETPETAETPLNDASRRHPTTGARLRLPTLGSLPPSGAKAPRKAPLEPRGVPPVSVPLTVVPPAASFQTAGPLTWAAVLIVLAVGIVFVRGSQTTPAELRSEGSRVKMAGERPPPARMRSWQDRYRADHPELLVGSPKVPYSGPRRRVKVRRLPKIGRPPQDGNLWPPARVEAATPPVSLALPPDTETPKYPDFPPSEGGDPETLALVRIRSVPPGARVEVAGRVLGLTPLLRARLPEMAKSRVRLQLPGYLPFEGSFEEEADGDLHLEVKLSPDPDADPVLRGERSR